MINRKIFGKSGRWCRWCARRCGAQTTTQAEATRRRRRRQRATTGQGPAGVRRTLARLLSVDRRPALRPPGRRRGRGRRGRGRLRHDVLRTRLQRAASFDVGPLSLPVRLVLSRRVRPLSAYRGRSRLQVDQTAPLPHPAPAAPAFQPRRVAKTALQTPHRRCCCCSSSSWGLHFWGPITKISYDNLTIILL